MARVETPVAPVSRPITTLPDAADSGKGKWMALAAALLGWMFDGAEMGIFSMVGRPAVKDLMAAHLEKLPAADQEAMVGLWFSIITAGFLVGAATGGVLFGWLGDRIGRVRAMTLSVLTYAVFTGVCGFAGEAWQVGILRFIASLGMALHLSFDLINSFGVVLLWPLSDWRPSVCGSSFGALKSYNSSSRRMRSSKSDDIGMTFDDVKRRSTMKVKEPRRMGDGTQLDVETVVFDYRIGDSGIHFPDSRYYWLATRKEDSEHITEINIGITPRKLLKPDLDAFQRRLQEQLLADGWMPGHFLAKSESTITLWGGRHTAGDGRYWLRGNTLLIFETNRMDERKSDEPAGSGEFILYLDLRPKNQEPELVYERSAWPN